MIKMQAVWMDVVVVVGMVVYGVRGWDDKDTGCMDGCGGGGWDGGVWCERLG